MTPDPARIRRILVRANNWIGDVVMISPAIRALRERFAHAEIAILARPWVCDTLASNPYFDILIPYEVPGRHAGWRGRLRLVREIRKRKFDLAVLFQKAFDAAFLSAAAGIPVRIGHDTDRRGWLLTHRVPFTPESNRRHHVDFFLEVAEACGCSGFSSAPFFCLSDADRAWADRFLSDVLPERNGARTSTESARGPAGAAPPDRLPIVAIHPGSSKPPRAWHAERFAELARQIAAEWSLVPVVVGDRDDAESGGKIARLVPATRIAAGRANVRQTGALLERARLFVGSDSGPMHIAGALGTPTVALFGPGAPEKTAPRAAGERLEVVTLRFPCSPCRQDFFRECDPAPTGKPFCIEEITVERVAQSCRRLLSAATAASRA